MSKLIVEMEMPVKEWNCLDCKAICADLMRGHYCGITKKTIDTLKNMRARPDWCPIKGELPEHHDRLVSEKAVRLAIDDIVLEIASRTGRVAMTKNETMEYVNRLPTIVEAERKKRW